MNPGIKSYLPSLISTINVPTPSQTSFIPSLCTCYSPPYTSSECLLGTSSAPKSHLKSTRVQSRRIYFTGPYLQILSLQILLMDLQFTPPSCKMYLLSLQPKTSSNLCLLPMLLLLLLQNHDTQSLTSPELYEPNSNFTLNVNKTIVNYR